MEISDIIEITGNKDIENEIIKIFNQLSNDESHPHIKINKLHKINALNKEAWGEIVVSGVKYYFHVKDGNVGGSEVIDFSKTRLDIPVTRLVKVMVPAPLPRHQFMNNDHYKTYLAGFNAKKGAFDEVARKYNYDLKMSPGHKTHQHYKEMAELLGFIWDTQEIESEI